MNFQLDYSEEARTDVRRLPGNYRQRIRRLILALSEQPRPPQAVLLRGNENIYRIRVDDWRIIYAVDDDSELVFVLRVKEKTGPETYEDLPIIPTN